MRGAGLGWETPAVINKEALAELVRLSDDLNQVGNRLKAWLDGELDQNAIDPAAIMRSLQDIKGEMVSVTSRLVD